ncbi:MAG TPA: hypothetical protein VKE94_11205, partial [Gemmataceae bacterium]|nr:hypothetical protein [Gemmataceae bacterium]
LHAETSLELLSTLPGETRRHVERCILAKHRSRSNRRLWQPPETLCILQQTRQSIQTPCRQ